jgi:hypothetical protein
VSDGDELLRFAVKQQADLIVMGAYGHTRLREWLFGGVTYETPWRARWPATSSAPSLRAPSPVLTTKT